MRFLGWGFRKPDIGDSRTDGPFALDGRFVLAENRIELTNATAEISETPLAGAVKLSLGQRKQLSVSLEGTKVDATQIRSGVLGLGTVKSLFLGGTSGTDKETAATGIDLALKLKLAELADGDRILRDVDAEMSIERGTLSMPRLRFSTPEGLAIDAEGSAKDIADRPDGSIRALVSAPNEAAAKTFIRLLDLDANDEASLERLSRLAPMRVAATLTLHSGETNTSHLAIDGLSAVAASRPRFNCRAGATAGARLRPTSPPPSRARASITWYPLSSTCGHRRQQPRHPQQPGAAPAQGGRNAHAGPADAGGHLRHILARLQRPRLPARPGPGGCFEARCAFPPLMHAAHLLSPRSQARREQQPEFRWQQLSRWA